MPAPTTPRARSRGPRCLAVGGFFAALLGAPSVLAHGGLPAGIAPFVEDGELVGAWTSYGFVEIDGDRGAWTAEESVEDGALWLHHAGDSRLLAGTFRGVVESTNWGCSWATLDGDLGTTKIGQIVGDPDDATHLFAFTDVTNAPVRVLESVDSGRQWQATGLGELDGNFLSAAVSAGASDLWVLVAPESGVELWRSAGVGGEWEIVDVDWTEGTHLGLRGALEDGVGVYLSDSVVNGEVSNARLLFLDTTGDSPPEPSLLASFDALQISAVVPFDGEVYVTVDSANTYRVGESPDDAQLLEDVPPLCGTQPEEGVLWGCGVLGYGDQLSSSTDLEVWQPHVSFGAVCPAACADGTIGAAANDALWPDVYLTGVGGDECVPEQFLPDDAGTSGSAGSGASDGGASSGGCALAPLPERTGRGASLAMFTGLVLWASRRRQVRRA